MKLIVTVADDLDVGPPRTTITTPDAFYRYSKADSGEELPWMSSETICSENSFVYT